MPANTVPELIIEIERFLEDESMQNSHVFNDIYKNPIFNDFKTIASKNIQSKEFKLYIKFLKVSRDKFNRQILNEKVNELKKYLKD